MIQSVKSKSSFHSHADTKHSCQPNIYEQIFARWHDISGLDQGDRVQMAADCHSKLWSIAFKDKNQCDGISTIDVSFLLS